VLLRKYKEFMKNDKKLIIMVDDDRINLHIGKNVLTEKFKVCTMLSAKKLFPILEKNKADLILLDIDMPEINGYEAIKALKENLETKDIPVIFLTARSKATDKATGLSLGAVDYITKPYEPSLLVERIEAHLDIQPISPC
jgi:DNA-binding response OmpR family regulator